MSEEHSMLGTRVVTQIGFIVHDVQKTAAEYAAFLGVPVPPIYETDTYEKTKAEYQGHPTQARAKQAFFKVGDQLEIELIQPDHEPSAWREFLDTHGEGVQHIAFVVTDGMQEISRRLIENGFPLTMKGEYDGGRYAYFDSFERLKIDLELLEND